GRRRGDQRREAPYEAAPEHQHERPRAEGPARRDPRSRPAAVGRQGHARMQPLRQADAGRPQDARQRPPRPRLPPLWRAAGGALMTSRLRERYRADVVPALQKQFSYGNPMQVPNVSKIVVNIGLGEARTT